MKVVFVTLGQENLGQGYLSAALKQRGHVTSLAYDPGLFADEYQFTIPALAGLLNGREKAQEAIRAAEPDMVCFTVFANNLRWALDMAAWVRENTDALIGFGGIHPTMYPEDTIAHPQVDFVGLGEAEETLPAFCDALERGDGSHRGIPGIWVSENGTVHRNDPPPIVKDLDRLPFPDKTLFEDAIRLRWKYRITTQRGCPNNCHFCCNGSWLRFYRGSRYLRRRSPENVLAELRQAKERYRFRWVAFYDDVFARDVAWLDEFLPRFKEEIGVHYSCNGYATQFDDAMARRLYDSGCRFLEIGIQAADEHVRRTVLNRRESNADIERALRAANAVGLHTQIDHMFGVPGVTEEDQVRAMLWYNELRPTRVGCYALTLYPGSALLETARREGWITEERARAIEQGDIDAYHDGGALESERQRALQRGFEFCYRLMPMVPRAVIREIAARRLYRRFGRMPLLSLHGLDLIMGYLTEHNVLRTYVKQNLMHAWRVSAWRARRALRPRSTS